MFLIKAIHARQVSAVPEFVKSLITKYQMAELERPTHIWS